MNRTADIVALFSFRRISGQIAALILGSLILIHVLIAGYFLLNQPKLLADTPLEQIELIVRIIANTPKAERTLVLNSVSRTFPALELQLRDGGSASATPQSMRTSLTIPSALGVRAELVRGSGTEASASGSTFPATTCSKPRSARRKCRPSSAACGHRRCCSWWRA